MNAINQYQTNGNPAAEFSWSAIFSGLLTSTAIGAIAALLGSAIGLTLFSPDADMVNFLSISAVLWIIITGAISMFIGGWITGYIAPYQPGMKASLHGFVLWSISFILGLMLSISSAGMFITGTAQIAGDALKMSQETVSSIAKPVTEAASPVMDNEALGKISKQVGSLLTKSDKNNKKINVDSVLQSKGDRKKELMSKVEEYLSNPDANSQQAHADMVSFLTQNTNLNQQQAEQVLTTWEDKYEEAAQKAKEATEQGSTIVGGMTFAAVVTMLIGLIATILGSCLGARYRKNRLD